MEVIKKKGGFRVPLTQGRNLRVFLAVRIMMPNDKDVKIMFFLGPTLIQTVLESTHGNKKGFRVPGPKGRN